MQFNNSYYEQCLRQWSIQGCLENLHKEKKESEEIINFHNKKLSQISEMIRRLENEVA